MARVWGRRPDEAELEWFYERNPVRPASVVLAEEDDRVVGSAALSFQPLNGIVGFAVGAYIAAAYWFTSSTSFANPAVTVGRTLTDTFAGISPSSVPLFVVCQCVGAFLAVALFFLSPELLTASRLLGGTAVLVLLRRQRALKVLFNMSVWESVEALEGFVWQTVHKRIYGRRPEWFEPLDRPHFVMWRVPVGHLPYVAEAKSRLEHLWAHGPSDYAFGWESIPSAQLWKTARCA